VDLSLKKISCDAAGFFGEVLTPGGFHMTYVAAHAYPGADGSWAMKVQPGTYTCQRGTHQLHATPPFETFEVTGVVGHSGILFHVGNWPQFDSDGCFLTGCNIGLLNSKPAVTSSEAAFGQFMTTQLGVTSFILTVQ
jgi:hypothetical protein